MARFRSKPVEIEATQFLKEGDHPAVVVAASLPPSSSRSGWAVEGAQGLSTVDAGDWIIKEPTGPGYYPCKPDVFLLKYEPVDGDWPPGTVFRLTGADGKPLPADWNLRKVDASASAE